MLTTKEASKLLKVSEVSVKRYIAQGLIPSVKIGGARRIVKNEVWEDFLSYNAENQEDNPEVINGVQFYWSQKSGAIAQQIYKEYCKENDIILDAFLGGGSSLYGVRHTHFKFVGVDINEMPYRIAKFNLQNIDNQFIASLEQQVKVLQEELGAVYRCETKEGKSLEFIKVVFDDKDNPQVKIVHLQDAEGNRFTSEDYPETIDWYEQSYALYKAKLSELENPLLVKNSRIAIKENMYLADIFSPINFWVLSALKERIKDNEHLKFILSSILQLCKLTDTKSQSQFPFWLPKTDLVDRNIFVTLLNKVQSLKKQIGQGTIPEVASFDRLKYAIGNACLLLNQPVQSITNEIPDNSIDFVLTDPPYFDQVAYSEYGKIWEFFCGYKANFEDEIIVSQRDVCQSDEALYLKNLQKAFEVIFKKMKPNAMMLVYFKDSRPEKMFAFLDILDKAGFYFVGQEYLETAKFTYKQNSTTKTTLAGESILKLQKALPTENAENEEAGKEITFIEIENLITHFAKTYLLTHTVASLNEILSNGLIKLLYDYKALTFLKKAKDITDILEKLANYDDEKRTYTLKNKELKNQLFLGNCLEILKAIPSQSIDCVITDPPYNISGYDHKKQIGWLKSNDYWKKDKAFKKIDETWDKFSDDDYETFTIEWLMELKRIVKPNGNIAIFGSYHNIYKIGYLIEKLDLKTINSIIWYKRNAFPNVTQRMFCESTEQIIWCVNNSKKDAKNWTFNYQTMKELNGGVQMRNLFDVPLTKASEKEHGKHPSQKPLEVLNNLVLALTNEGDVVLDCFLGSGTTAVSALQHKRNFIGIEQNYEYLQLAERRLEGVNIVSKPIKKDITYLGVDKIYHGLAEKLLANIPSESIACSVWSPPYHVGKEYEKEQSFEGWKNMLKQVIRLHYPITKKGGFMVINIADILCFPDETMPKIQLPNPSKHKVKLSKEEILEVKLKNPTWGKYDLANYFQCSEQTIDRRLHGNNIRGGKYITQTRIELVSQYIQEYAQEAGFYLYDRRVWKKDPSWHNSRWVSNSYRSVDEFEYIYMFWKAGETLINKDKLSSKEWSEWGSRAVWEFPSVRANQEHEAMFPLELPKRCIKLLTEEGDVVLDPFMGSGTTALACLETKRHFIGIEKEAQYIDLALKNIEKYTQKHQQLFIV